MSGRVVVVGAGVIGWCAAWRLAGAGFDVTVVAPSVAGAGPAGAAGVVGAAGAAGAAGVAGVAGVVGAAGAAGEFEAVGSAGWAGESGAVGAVGAVGAGGPGPVPASLVAAGMLAPESEAGFGEELLFRLNRAALQRFGDVAEEVERDAGQPVGLRREGTLLVARDGDDWSAVNRMAAYREALGLTARRVGATDRRRLEPFLSPEVRGAVLVEPEQSVDNRRYLRALEAAAARRGVRRVHGRVERLVRRDGAVTGVRLDAGARIDTRTQTGPGESAEIGADVVVLAAGSASAGIDGLPPGLHLPVRPVKGQILRLRPGSGAVPQVLRRTVRALVRGRDVYVVPRADGEVVVGATVEERGADTTVTAGAVLDLLDDACEIVPVLREHQLAECAVASRPGTPDNGPLVGPAGAGLVVATGHYRNGVLLSALTADAVLAAVRGEPLPPVWAPFSADRFAAPSTPAASPPTIHEEVP